MSGAVSKLRIPRIIAATLVAVLMALALLPSVAIASSGWIIDSGAIYYVDPYTGELASGGIRSVQGLCPPVAAQDGSTFVDVYDETAHAEDIAWMLESGISTGWVSSDGTRSYKPAAAVARCDMAAFLYRLAGSPDYTPTHDDTQRFSDVSWSTPHAAEIWWLASQGISQGWDMGSYREFRPSATVTRLDMAAFLYRLAGSPGLELTEEQIAAFSDVDDATPHANEVRWLSAVGVSKGWEMDDGTIEFRGMNGIVRQDMAAFLHRMFEYGIYVPTAEHAYCFSDEGALITGWADVDGSPHYFNTSNGVMLTDGLRNVEGLYYLFGSDGAVATGWQIIDGAVHHFDDQTGAMSAGGTAFIEGLCAPIAAVEGCSFADVSDDTAHVEDIVWMLETGISAGWVASDGSRTYRPSTAVTRQDMAAFLYRLAGSPDYVATAEDAKRFSDITPETPHATEIWWLASTGISQGWLGADGSRTFRPMDTVKRADMAAFLYRLAGSPDYTATVAEQAAFRDVSTSTAHASEIWWLASTGVSEGWSLGSFREYRPSGVVVRADMAAFLHRMITRGVFFPSTVHAYLFADDGSLVTGWSGGSYFDRSTGAQVTKGWVKDGASWYYIDPESGSFLASGLFSIAGYYYSFNADGLMQRGWATSDGAKRYFNPTSGVMVSGCILSIDGSTYCFSENGTLSTGWVEVTGIKRYFNPSTGKMYVNGIYVIDGKRYSFDANGNATQLPNLEPWSRTDSGWVSSNGEIINGAIAKGIDVSEWNGTVDWAKVKADGISFAILRVGYGYTIDGKYTADIDAEFERNAAECERLGIPYGVYIYSYARNATMAAAEADAVIKFLEGHTLSLPVYIDIEDINAQSSLKPADFASMATAFCTKIEQAGYTPGVYSMLSWFEVNFTSPVFDSWSKWIAQYYSECQYEGTYDIWQCSGSGTVAGIDYDVDLNFMFTDLLNGTGGGGETPAVEPTSGQVLANGVYEIAVASSPTLVMGVTGASTEDRANIGLETDANANSQRFRITWDYASEAYMLTNMNSGCVMDLAGSEAVAGANIQQYHAVGWLDQRWVITQVGSNYRIASAVDSRYYLTLGSSTPAAGVNVQLTDSSSNATTFTIRAV